MAACVFCLTSVSCPDFLLSIFRRCPVLHFIKLGKSANCRIVLDMFNMCVLELVQLCG